MVTRNEGSFDKHPKYQEEDTEERKEVRLISVSEVLNEFIRELSNRRYFLHPDPVGKWCFFSVYEFKKFQLPGLTVPDDFGYLGKILPDSELDRTRFSNAVRQVWEALKDDDDKLYTRLVQQIALCFLDKLSDPRSTVAMIAFSRMGRTEQQTTLTGQSGCYRFVPPLEWFSDELKALDCRKMLTLFPDAEADSLMLILGRIVAGAKGTQTYEGVLQHTARSFAIVVGEEPGLGKSTFKNHLESTLEVLGYVQATINPRLGNFGWGAVATSDLASIDDMTDEFIKKFLHESRVMSIVSNDKVTVEEKGQPAYEVSSKAVILGLTNVTNYNNYIGMSPGFVSRLNQLYTYSRYELKQRWSDLRDPRIREYWDDLARTLNVPVSVLVMRLLRHCLDLFLSVTGHTIVDGHLSYDPFKDTLEARLKANREQYVIDVSLTHVEELPKVAGEMVAAAIALQVMPKDRQKKLNRVEEMDFTPDLLLALLEMFALKDDTKPESLVLKQVSRAVVGHFVPQKAELKALKANRTLNDSFKAVIGQLTSTKGFSYPEKRATYQNYWISVRRSIQYRLNVYEDLEVSDEVSEILSKVASLI